MLKTQVSYHKKITWISALEHQRSNTGTCNEHDSATNSFLVCRGMYVVYFNHITLSCFNNVIQITEKSLNIAHSYHKKITWISAFECTLERHENFALEHRYLGEFDDENECWSACNKSSTCHGFAYHTPEFDASFAKQCYELTSPVWNAQAEDKVGTCCSSVVFEREAREFQSFLTAMFHSLEITRTLFKHLNVTRTYLALRARTQCQEEVLTFLVVRLRLVWQV